MTVEDRKLETMKRIADALESIAHYLERIVTAQEFRQ